MKRDINCSVIRLINILETIAINIKNAVVDEDIVYNFSYTFVIDLYYWLKRLF